jgi:metal-responsive CopG/Arc/MetJ family transcriptional regulator
MKDEYDFSKGKRGALISNKGKTRITIYLDDDILEQFRSRAEEAGTGYQTLINEALKEYLSQNSEKSLTEATLRRVLQEEFPKMVQMSTIAT